MSTVPLRLATSLFVASAAICVATIALAQQAPIVRQTPTQTSPLPPNADDSAQPTITITAITREVQLDVLVVDAKGHPFPGLKKQDFILTENGVPQKIRSFEEHGNGPPHGHASPNPVTKLPPNTFTNYTPVYDANASTVILIDALDSGLDAQMYLHQQLLAYLPTLKSGDPIAIFLLDNRMHLVQGFTTDPRVLIEAVKSKRCAPQLVPAVTPGNGPTARRIRQEIRASGMQMLGRYLAAFPGRKNLIWITGREPYKIIFDTAAGSAFPDYASFDGEFGGASDQLSLSRVAIYPLDAAGLSVDPKFSAANRGAPHLLNERFEENREKEQQHFEEIAQRTGGKAYISDNGIRQDIEQIVENGSHYYTIVYAPSDNRWYGQFRHIKVETSYTGLQLQYRDGYLARNSAKRAENNLAKASTSTRDFHPAAETLPPDAQGALLQRTGLESLQASMTMGEIPPTELIFNASVSPAATIEKKDKNEALPPENFLRPAFQKKPYREFDLLYAADLSKMRLNKSPDGIRHGEVQFIAVVYSDTGDVVNTLMTVATLDLTDSTYRSMLRSGLTMKQKIAIPLKPNCFLRLGIRDVAGDRMGALEIPVADIALGVAGLGQ